MLEQSESGTFELLSCDQYVTIRDSAMIQKGVDFMKRLNEKKVKKPGVRFEGDLPPLSLSNTSSAAGRAVNLNCTSAKKQNIAPKMSA